MTLLKSSRGLTTNTLGRKWLMQRHVRHQRHPHVLLVHNLTKTFASKQHIVHVIERLIVRLSEHPIMPCAVL